MNEHAFDLKRFDRVPSCIETALQASEKGDFHAARTMFRAAMKQLEGRDDRHARFIDVTRHIAETYLKEGRYDQASGWYGRALNACRRLHGSNSLPAACLITKLAEISALQSDMSTFQKHFEEMQRVYLLSRETDTNELIDLLVDLSWALCVLGQATEARHVNNFIAQLKLEESEMNDAARSE